MLNCFITREWDPFRALIKLLHEFPWAPSCSDALIRALPSWQREDRDAGVCSTGNAEEGRR